MKIILAYITLLLSTFAAFGHTVADTVKVHFRVGSSRLDPSFADNAQALHSFDAPLIKAVLENAVDSIVVRGYASPEGASAANLRLSGLRSQSVADYIVANTGISRALVRMYPEGVAWDELRSLVEANHDVPGRTEILNILDNVPIWVYGAGGKIVDGRKKRLMELDGGKAYNWMITHLFPKLRNAVAVSVYYSQTERDVISDMDTMSDSVVVSDTVVVSEPLIINLMDETKKKAEAYCNKVVEESDSTMMAMDVTSALDGRIWDPVIVKPSSFLMAVKTNMLYDAALVPNLGIEFSLSKRLSLYGEWMYAWWDSDSRHRFWRIYGGDLGLRWWFGHQAKASRLSGHHLGIYGGILTFDFELGDKGYMGGKPGGTLWDRYLVNAGIEYGFSLPVAKRLNIDFSIGLGYLGGNYIKYFPFDNDYYFQKEYKMRYFGPTKAEISLVWLIGSGYADSRKGGER